MSPKIQLVKKPLQDKPLPEMPWILEDPRPVLAIGIIAWIVFAVVCGITRGWSDSLVWTSIIGVVTGVLGYGVYAWQRNAVRRGATWVQDGLEEN